jgi:hypothetical protein
MPYLHREVALVRWLADRGAPVMGPATAMPAGPFLVEGWGIAAFAFVAHEPGALVDPASALVALDALHASMRPCPVELPLLGPATTDLDLALAFAVREDVIDRVEGRAISRRRDRLVQRLLASGDSPVPQHGDAFPRNAVMGPTGATWIDLEDACRGPRAWDLVVLARATDDPEFLHEGERRHGVEAIRAAWRLRDLQADVWRRLHEARVARGW